MEQIYSYSYNFPYISYISYNTFLVFMVLPLQYPYLGKFDHDLTVLPSSLESWLVRGIIPKWPNNSQDGAPQL